LRTKAAGAMAVRPTDLTNYLMESMKDGEIFWVVANGIGQRMPAFRARLNEPAQWEMVHYVRNWGPMTGRSHRGSRTRRRRPTTR
jgi:mono/diheme cytochrome c family protein